MDPKIAVCLRLSLGVILEDQPVKPLPLCAEVCRSISSTLLPCVVALLLELLSGVLQER